jgi:hypothetical protein
MSEVLKNIIFTQSAHRKKSVPIIRVHTGKKDINGVIGDLS